MAFTAIVPISYCAILLEDSGAVKCLTHGRVFDQSVLREDDGGLKALVIPEVALREMLADWRGAGRAILGGEADTAAWYAKHRDKMVLHPESRAWLEAHLSCP